jgi:hypothetical protein
MFHKFQYLGQFLSNFGINLSQHDPNEKSPPRLNKMKKKYSNLRTIFFLINGQILSIKILGIFSEF